MREILSDFQKQQPKLVEPIQPSNPAPQTPAVVDLVTQKPDPPSSHAACDAKVLNLQNRLNASQKQLAARDHQIHSLVAAHAAELSQSQKHLTDVQNRLVAAEGLLVAAAQASSAASIKHAAELKHAESRLSVADIEMTRVQSALKVSTESGCDLQARLDESQKELAATQQQLQTYKSSFCFACFPCFRPS